MKKTLLAVAAAILAVTAATGTPALAQGWQPGPYDRAPGHLHRQLPDSHPNAYPNAPLNSHWPDRRPGPPEGRGWRAGERLPHEWRAQHYVIVKPAAYHLHRPPRGHRWIRVGHDAVLVVSTTGVIVEVAPGLFR
nr:RcnB family protein [Azospirillum sp. 412522]